MRRRWTILLVLMTLLAGCSAFSGGPSATETPTADRTPTLPPTSTGTRTPDPVEELAPGITHEGIGNPVALMSAHQRELLSDGFVVNHTVESTYNGTVTNRLRMTTTVGPGGELASQNATSTASDPSGNESVITNDLWLNTTVQVSRHIESRVASYRIQPRLYPPESLVWFGSLQTDIQFAADKFEVTDVERRDDRRFVTLSVSYDRVGNDGVDDTQGTLVVEERGVIHHAEMNVTYEEGTTYRTTYDVTELGDVDPAPPVWLDAVPKSAALTVGLDVFSFEATHIELVHTYGDAAPAGSIVTIVSNGTLYETTLDGPFGDGTRYLWISDDGRLRATTERPPPGEARALDSEITVTVRAPDGGELFSTAIGRQ